MCDAGTHPLCYDMALVGDSQLLKSFPQGFRGNACAENISWALPLNPNVKL